MVEPYRVEGLLCGFRRRGAAGARIFGRRPELGVIMALTLRLGLAVLIGTAVEFCICDPPTQYVNSFQVQSNRVGTLRVPEMVFINGGEFLMGSPITDDNAPDYHADERARILKVAPFRLGRYIVTAEEYCRFLNEQGDRGYGRWGPRETISQSNGRYWPTTFCERCPASAVNWAGATAYCQWLSQQTGQPFRLPTEAEWEYAARGPELRPWPWGSEQPAESEELVQLDYLKIPFFDKYGARWIYRPYRDEPFTRAPVGSFPRNQTPEGLYDMLGYQGGYAGQWCSDLFSSTESKNAKGEGLRVVRGVSERRSNSKWIVKQRQRLGLFELLHNVVGETHVRQNHEGRSWTRDGRDEQTAYALIRLAQDRY
jgi:formylglycine-generating enzyme required for sulfatase activity